MHYKQTCEYISLVLQSGLNVLVSTQAHLIFSNVNFSMIVHFWATLSCLIRFRASCIENIIFNVCRTLKNIEPFSMSLRNQLFTNTLMSKCKKNTDMQHNSKAILLRGNHAEILCGVPVFFLPSLIRVLENSWFLKLIKKCSLFFLKNLYSVSSGNSP